MGKRAKKAPVQTKKRQTLAKQFKCPFCANDEVVECKMDLKNGTGSLSCRMCSASYSMPIHHLHEPVDVFSEWLDDCEAAERGEVAAAPVGGTARGGGNTTNMRNVVHDTSQDHYDDDDSVESEGLPEASGLGMKRPAEEQSSGKEEGGAGNKKQKAASMATLGLDESDDDDDSE
ncbi:hypothetical protein ACHAWT_005781 [Skeletonema menzelii]|mmetsp:Transcript_13914/g.22779  ORF Transcript_13914/g.22779 Transcript_13914/m.22779 type:complete len:175 (-) Transcript_13914:27-551(-)